MESLVAELNREVPEPALAVLCEIHETVIESLSLGFDPSVLLVLDNEDADQQDIEHLKFKISEQIVSRMMGRANSVVLFGKVKPGDAGSFTKVILRLGMKPAKIYILALALFLVDPALEPLAGRSFSRAILGRILAEELGFRSTAVERVEMGRSFSRSAGFPPSSTRSAGASPWTRRSSPPGTRCWASPSSESTTCPATWRTFSCTVTFPSFNDRCRRRP